MGYVGPATRGEFVTALTILPLLTLVTGFIAWYVLCVAGLVDTNKHHYRVLAPLPPPSSQDLSLGQCVTYQGSGYSRYDSASIHHFLTESGEPREWWLFDADSLEQAQALFAPAE
jgi:hypothetical protein